jgi:lon-related putative ATP-dependent protease
MATVEPLSPEKVRQTCDPAQFDFKTTADLEDLDGIVGQERAVEAILFGMRIRHEGYNLFALGPSGTGKRTTIARFLERQAASEPIPSDWCYVNNFEEPHKPRALQLPAGQAAVLRQDVGELVGELKTAVPTAFESEDYRTRKQEVDEELKEKQEGAFGEVQKTAQEREIALIRTPAGLAFAPLREGEVVTPEDFAELPEKERKEVEASISDLQGRLQETIHQVRQWEREAREKVKELDREVAIFAVGHLIEELRQKHADLPAVVEYLNALQEDVIANVDQFRKAEEPTQFMGVPLPRSMAGPSLFRRYQVNVLVDHSESEGAPVVYEEHPTYSNLVGRIEHLAQMGALVTDFNMIKAGALHQANGGYLILDARQLLLQPYAWEGLKRALRSREVRVESLANALSLVSTVSLEPVSVPLDAKVVLIGDRMLYYLLNQHDPDFGELFKVEADFGNEMERDPEGVRAFARLVGTLARRHEIRPLDRAGVARVIEYSARLAGDAAKLSVHLLSITDLLREADYWAGEAKHKVVTADDVQKAIDAQIHRSDRLRERAQEQIRRGTVMIDVEGECVGQVNGLSVVALGRLAFGRPSRITARVRVGKGEVVDIEREVEMGGPIHSKGVLILSGFLGARYAFERPLSLSASLVFEQSYGGVEGDSASLAELCAMLSALAGVPIKQSLAITGSVNQLGYAQPIGGVNEKIEGFFDVCKAGGLTGEQGVIIPASNAQHLMLRSDVVEAVKKKTFHVYSVESVDQAIELLTGIPAGERDKEGNYVEKSINQLVEARLTAFSERLQAFASRPAEQEESDRQGKEEGE